MERVNRHGRWQLMMVWAALGLVALWAAFVLMLRFRIRSVLDGVRVVNKRVLNPIMLRLAGREHWYAAVIQHTGRRTGRPYATPVVAQPTDNGFVIPLPYGEHVDWLRNVLAAGQATITAQGKRAPVDQPHVVDRTEVEPLLPPRLRRSFRLYSIERFLQVHTRATPEQAPTALPARPRQRERATPV